MKSIFINLIEFMKTIQLEYIIESIVTIERLVQK